MKERSQDQIRTAVRQEYGQIAKEGSAGCDCGCGPVCGEVSAPSSEQLSAKMGYSETEISEAPDGANLGLGCGNPHAIASLRPGETVVDLGSGAGFDCFLAARQVGESGSVIGVDMTPEMNTRARQSAREAGVANVEFRLGEIEHLPVGDGEADVIISNCVINLSPEKSQVFREAFRILRRGGRLAVSDVITTAPLPESLLHDMKAYTGCISGAVDASEVESMLAEAGFVDIHVKPIDESRELIREWTQGGDLRDYVVSAMIEARKP
jgi:SAM-dependent methyltransferase